MSDRIKKIGVIGAGVMGAQLAALFAGAGCDVELLDIAELASGAVARLPKMKPPPLYVAADVSHIQPGNIEKDLERLGKCDLIVEAVIERLDVKKDIYARVANVIGKNSILASNTSGILRSSLVEGMPAELARRFFITHFFNPPRYMKLLEIVSADGADAGAMDVLTTFAERKLGKGVVRAKDTPLFIANRIGVFFILDIMHRMVEEGWPIEAVDAVMGRATAHPKSAIFRTADMVGLDTLTFVAAELVKGCPNDESADRCRIPQFLQQMVVRGQIGDKKGEGFYRRDKETGQIFAFDPSSGNFRPKIQFNTPSISEALKIKNPAERIRHVVFSRDQASEIAWPAISSLLVYAANRIPEISDDVVSVDHAMRWGYNWELGPFETLDALGIGEVADRLAKEGKKVPKLVEDTLRADRLHFYEWRGHRRMYFDPAKKNYEEEPDSAERITIGRWKELGRVVEENAGASLVDVGDGVFACEFHTKMNAIDGDIVKMLHASLDRVEKEGIGLIIANDGEQFSVGANLLLVLMSAAQKRWGEIETMVREFQSVNQRIRFSPKPVIAVPFGMTLGGGCEISLAAWRRAAAIETYIGLVEVGAGVIPAGGGCKNLLLMLEKTAHGGGPSPRRSGYDRAGGPQPKVSAAFELIATAKVAGSAREARGLGFLSKDDLIVMDREILIHEAGKFLRSIAADYLSPTPRTDIELPGRGGEMALRNAVRGFLAQKKATEYDAFIADKLAHVLAGGDCPTIHETTEDHILDLEREAFLSLVGEERTQKRMENLLKTGKPLRN